VKDEPGKKGVLLDRSPLSLMSSVSALSGCLDEFDDRDPEGGPSLPYINLNKNNQAVLLNKRCQLKISQSLRRVQAHLHIGRPLRAIGGGTLYNGSVGEGEQGPMEEERKRTPPPINRRESILELESENSSAKESFQLQFQKERALKNS
jgi:hypothetical protein